MGADAGTETLGALRLLLDTALDAVVVIEAEGVITGWNAVAERTFGWSRVEAVGRNLGDLIVPSAYRTQHRDGMSRYHASGKPTVLNRRIEITALHRDGHEFPVELSITMARAPGGILFVGYLRDISERRAQEQALREAKANADALAAEREATLSQLAEAVILADSEGQIVFVNEAAARLHGTARLQVGPEDYSASYSLLTEDRRPYPSTDLPLARAVRGESVSEARWRIRRPDGSEVLALGSARPIYDPSGKQIGAVLTAHDETDRVEAEIALRELNESLEERVAALAAERQRIWEISKDLLVVIGFDGFYRTANPAWLDVLGYEPQGLIGTRFDELVHADDVEATQRAFERIVQGKVVKIWTSASGQKVALSAASVGPAFRWMMFFTHQAGMSLSKGKLKSSFASRRRWKR